MNFYSSFGRGRIDTYQYLVHGERYFLYSTGDANYYFRFRCGTVPGIHHHKASRRSYFRSGIDCLSEKRAWFDYQEQFVEYAVPVRQRRNPKALPSAWDDVGYSHGYCSRSWKKCTKKRRQWGGEVQLVCVG